MKWITSSKLAELDATHTPVNDYAAPLYRLVPTDLATTRDTFQFEAVLEPLSKQPVNEKTQTATSSIPCDETAQLLWLAVLFYIVKQFKRKGISNNFSSSTAAPVLPSVYYTASAKGNKQTTPSSPWAATVRATLSTAK